MSRLKGETRPVHTIEHRAEVLSALECVDWVVEFKDDTPIDIINYLKPNVLVKGGDYSIDTIVGASEVLKSGGEVKVLAFTKGLSTTRILNNR